MQTDSQQQKIAVIGSGIAGLTSAYLLSRQHDVHVYEANDYIGGHTHTQSVEIDGRILPVNTGFIVYNDWTYPNFIRLMEQLGVQTEASNMSFSVRCENTGLEYNGNNLNSLFAQRRNLFRPKFWRMIRDILRFNKQSLALVEADAFEQEQTLGEFFREHNYSHEFIYFYIVPMGAAIWSASYDMMLSFPLRFFLRFFKNHGLLSVNNRPQWRVLTGGSHSYVAPITAPYRQQIYLNCPISRVERDADGVTLHSSRGAERFDQVVFACHSDQALAMLANPSEAEQAILGAIPYQMNDVVLHTDRRFMPKRKLAWASWNYHIPQRTPDCAMLTYYMNLLQNFGETSEPILVTLNRSNEIDPAKVINRFRYSHPVFTADGMLAQARHSEISGQHRSHYCGAYWFNGFHEDGVNSALRVAKAFGISL